MQKSWKIKIEDLVKKYGLPVGLQVLTVIHYFLSFYQILGQNFATAKYGNCFVVWGMCGSRDLHTGWSLSL